MPLLTLPRVRPGLVRVRGRSMLPTLRDGDVLLVLWGGSPRTGAVVLAELPPTSDGTPRPLAVKRLTGPDPGRPGDPDRVWVEGDNPGVGVDSWTVGSLRRSAIRARVLLRLPRLAGGTPPARAGATGEG